MTTPLPDRLAQAIHPPCCRRCRLNLPCGGPDEADYELAETLGPVVEAEKAAWTRAIADRLNNWEFPARSDALEPMYRLVQTLRIEADRLEDK